MKRSLCIDLVFVGVFSYADRILSDENDPLNILLAEEEEESQDCNPYLRSSTLCWATVKYVEEE